LDDENEGDSLLRRLRLSFLDFFFFGLEHDLDATLLVLLVTFSSCDVMPAPLPLLESS
jgi:hypothetical protein